MWKVNGNYDNITVSKFCNKFVYSIKTTKDIGYTVLYITYYNIVGITLFIYILPYTCIYVICTSLNLP